MNLIIPNLLNTNDRNRLDFELSINFIDNHYCQISNKLILDDLLSINEKCYLDTILLWNAKIPSSYYNNQYFKEIFLSINDKNLFSQIWKRFGSDLIEKYFHNGISIINSYTDSCPKLDSEVNVLFDSLYNYFNSIIDTNNDSLFKIDDIVIDNNYFYNIIIYFINFYINNKYEINYLYHKSKIYDNHHIVIDSQITSFNNLNFIDPNYKYKYIIININDKIIIRHRVINDNIHSFSDNIEFDSIDSAINYVSNLEQNLHNNFISYLDDQIKNNNINESEQIINITLENINNNYNNNIIDELEKMPNIILENINIDNNIIDESNRIPNIHINIISNNSNISEIKIDKNHKEISDNINIIETQFNEKIEVIKNISNSLNNTANNINSNINDIIHEDIKSNNIIQDSSSNKILDKYIKPYSKYLYFGGALCMVGIAFIYKKIYNKNNNYKNNNNNDDTNTVMI